MKYIINKQTKTATETISVLGEIYKAIGNISIDNIECGYDIKVEIKPRNEC